MDDSGPPPPLPPSSSVGGPLPGLPPAYSTMDDDLTSWHHPSGQSAFDCFGGPPFHQHHGGATTTVAAAAAANGPPTYGGATTTVAAAASANGPPTVVAAAAANGPPTYEGATVVPPLPPLFSPFDEYPSFDENHYTDGWIGGNNGPPLEETLVISSTSKPSKSTKEKKKKKKATKAGTTNTANAKHKRWSRSVEGQADLRAAVASFDEIRKENSSYTIHDHAAALNNKFVYGTLHNYCRLDGKRSIIPQGKWKHPDQELKADANLQLAQILMDLCKDVYGEMPHVKHTKVLVKQVTEKCPTWRDRDKEHTVIREVAVEGGFIPSIEYADANQDAHEKNDGQVGKYVNAVTFKCISHVVLSAKTGGYKFTDTNPKRKTKNEDKVKAEAGQLLTKLKLCGFKLVQGYEGLLRLKNTAVTEDMEWTWAHHKFDPEDPNSVREIVMGSDMSTWTLDDVPDS